MSRAIQRLRAVQWRGEGIAPCQYALTLLLFLALGNLSAFADTGATTNAAITNAAAAPVISTNLPDMGSSMLRVFGALVLVIAVFLGGVWLFRNWQRFAVQKGSAPKLNVIEVKSLGQRQAIYVIGYQQQRMLLASSPAGITLVSHLPAEDAVEAAPAARMSFAEAFQQVLTRKQC